MPVPGADRLVGRARVGASSVTDHRPRDAGHLVKSSLRPPESAERERRQLHLGLRSSVTRDTHATQFMRRTRSRARDKFI